MQKQLSRPFVWLSALALVGCAALGGGLKTGDAIPYPEGYRDWTHVKSLALLPGHELYETFGGIHHIYANAAALAGLKAGQGEYADGAVLVFDLLEAKNEGGALSEGARKVVGVMHKSAKAFPATGGWAFAGFAGDSRENIVKDAVNGCFECHTSQKDAGFVFSTWRP